MPAVAQVERLILEDPADLIPAAVRATAGESITDLAARWVAAWDVQEIVFADLREAELAAAALYPEAPAEIILQEHFTGERRQMTRQWFVEHRLAAGVAAYDRWTAQRDAIDRAQGVPGKDAAYNEASMAAQRIAMTIAATLPTTVAEAAAKYGVLLKQFGDGRGGIDDPRPFFDFLADLEHLAAAAAHT